MTATILVADIRAFTTLSEHYSSAPNIVMQAAQKVFSRFHDEIYKNHGQVEKIAGDAVMAYWQGDDRPGEDHNVCAYHSCYAALKIKEAVPHIASGTDWPFPDFPLQVDIALATGPVATGVLGGGKSAMAVLGDTANLAFRMEKLIPQDRPGDIIVDGATHELVSTQFIFESLGSQVVKGRQKPVDLYRLISLKS
jgi:adenylate cyclase